MKIRAILPVDPYHVRASEPECLMVVVDHHGAPYGVRWKFDTAAPQIDFLVRQLGAIWTGTFWRFQDVVNCERVIDAVQRCHPGWPVLGLREDGRQEFATKYERVHIGAHAGLLLEDPLPFSLSLKAFRDIVLLRLDGSQRLLAVGALTTIDNLARDLERQGMERDTNSACGALFPSVQSARVTATGWSISIKCDLQNMLHLLLAPGICTLEGRRDSKQQPKHGWDGQIHLTRATWTAWRGHLMELGIEWEGDDLDLAANAAIDFDTSRVPGLAQPTTAGRLLHEYQREGIRFIVSRGMRALVADEMGTGKTAQAIGATEAAGASHVVVVCPTSARLVWEREIHSWGSGGDIQLVENQLHQIDGKVRWTIVSYSQMTSRAETWKVNDAAEENALVDALPEIGCRLAEQKRYPKKLKFDLPSTAAPQFAAPGRATAWTRMQRRLSNELVEQLKRLNGGQFILIADEAHRVKNENAGCTRAIQRLAHVADGVLLLTGTPLRNHEREACALLGLLDENARHDLSSKNGYTINDIKQYLRHFMIRRTKQEVLPQLPPKTRQRIDIDQLDGPSMELYAEHLGVAVDNYIQAIDMGLTEHSAREKMRGELKRACRALGLAKVRGGEVVDLVTDVVQNKGSCVVFAAHRLVSDELHRQLQKTGLRAAVFDGRTSLNERARIIDEFQEGRLDVFIGGIEAAGESIPLTRSDTAIFVELHWVPAVLLQAESRIHRNGQRDHCHIIHLIARTSASMDNIDEWMIDVLGTKMNRIGAVLDEDRSNLVAAEGSAMKEVIQILLEARQVPRERQKSCEVKRRGRPALPDDERARRRARSKAAWREANPEKQRVYQQRWRNKKLADGTK